MSMRLAVLLLGMAMICIQAKAAPLTLELLGQRAFPESITSTHDGTLYIGSLGQGGIQHAPRGAQTAQQWVKPGAFGSASIFGVLADEKSNTLWACSNDLSTLGIAIAGSDKQSTLKGFDLKTGVGKVSAPLPGASAFCNDIAVGPDGSIYVTNTRGPQIFKLSRDRKTFDTWLSDAQLQAEGKDAGLDGLAFGSDGNLYVDTYSKALLFRVDVKDGNAGKVTRITPSRPLVLADALRHIEGKTFLLIEGGGNLDRVTFTGDNAQIETLKDGFAIPTGATQTNSHTAWVSEGGVS